MAEEDPAPTAVRGSGLVIHYRDAQFAWQEWFVGLKDGDPGLTTDGLRHRMMAAGSTFQHLDLVTVVLARRTNGTNTGELLERSLEYGAGTHVVVLSMPMPFKPEQDKYVTIVGEDAFNATQPGKAQCMLKAYRGVVGMAPELPNADMFSEIAVASQKKNATRVWNHEEPVSQSLPHAHTHTHTHTHTHAHTHTHTHTHARAACVNAWLQCDCVRASRARACMCPRAPAPVPLPTPQHFKGWPSVALELATKFNAKVKLPVAIYDSTCLTTHSQVGAGPSPEQMSQVGKSLLDWVRGCTHGPARTISHTLQGVGSLSTPAAPWCRSLGEGHRRTCCVAARSGEAAAPFGVVGSHSLHRHPRWPRLAGTAEAARTLPPTLAHSRTLSHTPAHSRTLSHTLARSRTPSHTLPPSRTLSHARSTLSHTPAHSRTLPHTLAPSRTHSLARSLSLAHSRRIAPRLSRGVSACHVTLHGTVLCRRRWSSGTSSASSSTPLSR